MLQSFIDDLRQENLCTHFVLPFLKVNKFSFISANFVNSYLNTDGTRIVVEIIEPLLLSGYLLKLPQCEGLFTMSDRYFVVYTIPPTWYRDVHQFMDGKFSRMSRIAQECIKRFSGLKHKEKIGSQILTDGKLLALEKHPLLRWLWESELSLQLSEDEELLSIPDEKSYIKLESLMPVSKTLV